MDAAVRLITREPENCDEKEFEDFVSLVMAGGEVAPRGLEARVRRARQLIFFYTGQCLSAVAALKQREMLIENQSIAAPTLNWTRKPTPSSWVGFLSCRRRVARNIRLI